MVFVKGDAGHVHTQASRFVFELLTHKLDVEQAHGLAAELDWHDVLTVSGDYLVTPSLFLSLQSKGLLDSVPDDPREALEWIHSANADRNRRLLHAWDRLCTTLGDAGVRCLPLKGIALLHYGYCDIGDRVLSDLDFIVAGSQLPDALQALSAAGYRQISNVNDPASFKSEPEFAVIDPLDFRNRVHAIGYQLPAILPPAEELVLELHYRIGDKHDGISSYMQSLFDPLLQSDKALERTDALDHFLIAHTFYHAHVKDAGHANGSLDLRHLLDIERFVIVGADVNGSVQKLRGQLEPADRAALASFTQICADLWPDSVRALENMDATERDAVTHFNRLRAHPYLAMLARLKSEMRRKSRFWLAPGGLKSLYGDKSAGLLFVGLIRYGFIRSVRLILRRKT